MKDETSSVHIIHFYEAEEVANSYLGNPRAAEYLQPYDSDNEEDDNLSFNKTNHALGSGIYGVGKLASEQIDEIISLSKEKIFAEMVSSLKEFLQDSKTNNSNQLVAMPINYLIGKLGFTGVVSDANDIFSRGLILTHVEDPYLNWMKVAVKNVIDPLLTPFRTIIKSGTAGLLEQGNVTNSNSREDLSSSLVRLTIAD